MIVNNYSEKMFTKFDVLGKSRMLRNIDLGGDANL